MSLATVHVGLLLLCAVLCLQGAQAHPTAYVSALFGNDSSDCSQCFPCKTIGQGMQTVWSRSSITMTVILYQGSYSLENQFSNIHLPLSMESELFISGGEFPSHCNFPSMTADFGSSHSVALSGFWNMNSYSQRLSVTFSNLEWDASGLHNIPMLASAEVNAVTWANCSIKCGNDSFVTFNNLENQCRVTISQSTITGGAWTIVGLPNTPNSFPFNIVVKDSIFETNNTVNLRYHPISSITVSGSTFRNDLQLIGLHSFSMNLSTLVESFVRLDSFLVHISMFYNVIWDSQFSLHSSGVGTALFRFNQFEQSTSNTDPLRQIFADTGCSLDLQGNWLGSPAGAYSCCNVASNGLFITVGNIEVWCIDPNCTTLSGPIKPMPNGLCYQAPGCQSEILCSPGIHASIVTSVAFISSGIVIVALFSLILCLRRRMQGKEERSLLNSSPDLVEPHHKRIQILLAAVSIFVDLMVIFAAWVPSKLSPPRPTTSSLALLPWVVNLAILLSAVASIRIFSNIWLIFLMLRGGRYRSLFANVIFSALAMLLCMFWRLSSTLNAYDVAQLDPNGESQLEILTENTTYFWILYTTHLFAVVLLGIPSLMISVNIITVRDYSEVEKIKEDVFHLSGSTSGESLLHTGIFFKVCRALSYVCFLLMAIYIITAVVFLLVGSGPVNGPTVPTVLISVTFMSTASAFMYFYGFVYLRWRFYEMSRGWLFVAISLAIALSALEFTIVYAKNMVDEAGDSRNGIATAPSSPEVQSVKTALFAIPTTLLCILVLTALTMSVLLRRMRSRLAPSVVENVYDRLERTFGE